MSFESITKTIAHKAAELSNDAMGKLADRRVPHEDDLTGVLLGTLWQGLKGFQTGSIVWDVQILSHRRSGQEKKYGGDMLIHVKMDTPDQTYSTQTSVPLRSGRAGVYDLPQGVRMYLFQILLPRADNSGRAFPKEEFELVKRRLAADFDEVTTYIRSPAEDLWSERGSKVSEDVVIFEVMAEALDLADWKVRRAGLEAQFRQEKVAVRYMTIAVV